MKFSTKAEYGLKAMTRLAQKYPKKESLSNIALRENLPEKYLERLASTLKKGGLIESIKGVNGGYQLTKNPKRISVGEIIEVLEGTIAPMKCAETKLQNCGCADCDCSTRQVWVKLEKQIRKTLYSMKLSDLI